MLLNKKFSFAYTEYHLCIINILKWRLISKTKHKQKNNVEFSFNIIKTKSFINLKY
ncbi:hypothetical protein C8J95_103191 [Elizabethkingia sp. YR214]|nr:hypothetical protein C8J95_103191 [Elizabethkingia sp. YR214]